MLLCGLLFSFSICFLSFTLFAEDNLCNLDGNGPQGIMVIHSTITGLLPPPLLMMPISLHHFHIHFHHLSGNGKQRTEISASWTCSTDSQLHSSTLFHFHFFWAPPPASRLLGPSSTVRGSQRDMWHLDIPYHSIPFHWWPSAWAEQQTPFVTQLVAVWAKKVCVAKYGSGRSPIPRMGVCNNGHWHWQ